MQSTVYFPPQYGRPKDQQSWEQLVAKSTATLAVAFVITQSVLQVLSHIR